MRACVVERGRASGSLPPPFVVLSLVWLVSPRLGRPWRGVVETEGPLGGGGGLECSRTCGGGSQSFFGPAAAPGLRALNNVES